MPYSKGLRSSWGVRITVTITSGYAWNNDSIYAGYAYAFNL